MRKEFIKVNKSIYYYKQYVREVEWLKYNVKRRILDSLDKEFIVVKDFEESYDRLRICLYNKNLDLAIDIECFKRDRETFV